MAEFGKIFVGGVSQETDEETLKAHFGKYGEVKESQIIKDRITGKARGFGFVRFSEVSAFHRAIQDEHIILGKTVQVTHAKPRGEISQNQNNSDGNSDIPINPKKVFVGGLPSYLTEEEFKEYFEKFGEITDVVVMYDKENKRSRGFGFVTFDSEEAADNVVQIRFHELNDKRMEAKRAEPKHRSSRDMHTNNSYNTRLGFDGSPISGSFGPYAPHCTFSGYMFPYGPGYYYGVYPYGPGFPTMLDNGVSVESFSDVPLGSYYQNPPSYGNHAVYHTYTNAGGCNNGWANAALGYGDDTHLETAISVVDGNSTENENDRGGDAKVSGSNKNESGANAEELTARMIQLQTDDALCSESTDDALCSESSDAERRMVSDTNENKSVTDAVEVPLCMIRLQIDDVACPESSALQHWKEADTL